MKKAILAVFFFCSGLPLWATGKGHLLIIGGGEKPLQVLKEFVTLCHDKPILIITSASGDAVEAGTDMVKQFTEAGAKNVAWRNIDGPAIANSDSMVANISKSGGIFFTGGDQDRLMQRVGGSRSEKALHALYREKGAIIGGTSAGAAVMSKVMITGNELINKDSTSIFVTIQTGNVETKTGFGFMDDVIIDQHFAARKRHNRLICVVLEHPTLPGIGIDEDTAILVYPDNTFRVYGEGTVIVYDARQATGIRHNDKGVLAARNLKMDLLFAGDRYSPAGKGSSSR
jgi:cyanophycinase